MEAFVAEFMAASQNGGFRGVKVSTLAMLKARYEGITQRAYVGSLLKGYWPLSKEF